MTSAVLCKSCRHVSIFTLKIGFEPAIYILCYGVSVGNINLHFQTFILPLIVIIQ